MNYIYQINGFWEKFNELEETKGYHISVYFTLLFFNNECSWKRKFDVTIGQALNQCKLDKDTYYKSLEFLNKNGFFDFYEKGKNQYSKAVFSLKVLYDISDSIQETTLDSTNNAIPNIGTHTRQHTDGTPDSIQNNLKHINIETNKQETLNNKGDFENEFEPEILEDNIIPLQTEKEKKEKEKTSGQKEKETKPEFSLDDVIWPFESKEFDSTWMLWLSYRKERGLAKYKPIGLQACLKDLAKISDGSESKAIDIIHNAIAKNWQGLFPIRENNQNNGRNQTRFTQEGLAAAVYAKWGKTGN